MITALPLAFLLWTAASAGAQQPAVVSRGTFEITVLTSGTVVAAGVFRLKAAIEGRVEMVDAATYTWRNSGEVLGLLANSELAAMMDAPGNSGQDALRERWKTVYKPAKIMCPTDCYILKSFITPKKNIKAQAVLIEAAKTLRLIGRVKPQDAGNLKTNQILYFWPAADPGNRMQVPITQIDSRGTFAAEMSQDNYLPPGAEWEGLIITLSKKNALMVPTSAILRRNNVSYLPVQVTEGIKTEDMTEILTGAEENQPILILRR